MTDIFLYFYWDRNYNLLSLSMIGLSLPIIQKNIILTNILLLGQC